MTGVFIPGLFGDSFEEFMTGRGTCAAPPDSLPLRLLGLAVMPTTRAGVQDAFRRRVMQLHPDTAVYWANQSLAAGALAAAERDSSVREVMWARDILLRKVHDVTASDGGARGTANSRNEWPDLTRRRPRKAQARIDELAAEIVAEYRSAGKTLAARQAATLAERRMRRLARSDCRWCVGCGRALDPDEPVWLPYSNYGGTVPRCSGCRSWAWETRGMKRGPCETCGREVHRGGWRGDRLYCCERCRDLAELSRRREVRSEARAELRCQHCGEPVDAGRADARYCSAACRQRAYRARRAKEVTT